jgi:hypothetical protein
MIRRLSVLLAMVVLCPAAAGAATNSLHEGAWGLEFQVESPLFRAPGAAGICVIRHISDYSALRLGTMVGINSEDSEGAQTQEFKAPWDSLQASSRLSSYSDSRDVSLFLHFAHYVGVGRRLAMRLEAGPSARWSSFERGRTESASYPGPSVTTNVSIGDGNAWSYGVDLQGGIEWFIRSRLSLAVRYGITAQRTEIDRTDRYENYRSDGYSEIQSLDTHSDGYNIQTTPSIVSIIGYW